MKSYIPVSQFAIRTEPVKGFNTHVRTEFSQNNKIQNRSNVRNFNKNLEWLHIEILCIMTDNRTFIMNVSAG